MKRVRVLSMMTIAATLLINGCGLTKTQKEGVRTFGKATATLGAASRDQFVGGRERVVEMRRQQLAMERKVLSPKKPDGTAANREFYAGELNLDSGMDPVNIQRRVDAVELLIRYGNLLVAFSEDTQEKELTTAAEQFTDSVKSFPGNPLTTAEIDGLGRLVVVAGKMWVENEKKEALKSIIPMVSPLMTQLCGQLEKDFDLKKHGLAADLNNVQDRLANEAIEGLKLDGGTADDRLLLIDGFALADRNKAELDKASVQLLKTVATMREADKKLVSLINDDRITLESINQFGKDANDLAKAVKPFIR